MLSMYPASTRPYAESASFCSTRSEAATRMRITRYRGMLTRAIDPSGGAIRTRQSKEPRTSSPSMTAAPLIWSIPC